MKAMYQTHLLPTLQSELTSETPSVKELQPAWVKSLRQLSGKIQDTYKLLIQNGINPVNFIADLPREKNIGFALGLAEANRAAPKPFAISAEKDTLSLTLDIKWYDVKDIFLVFGDSTAENINTSVGSDPLPQWLKDLMGSGGRVPIGSVSVPITEIMQKIKETPGAEDFLKKILEQP